MGNGIDASTNISNALNCLKNNSKTFIGRYFAVVNTWKALTRTEAQNISAAGIYIVSIWKDRESLCGINVDLDVSNGAAGGWKY